MPATFNLTRHPVGVSWAPQPAGRCVVATALLESLVALGQVNGPYQYRNDLPGVRGVLASLHADDIPTIEVHDFDIVDWSVWWTPVDE